MFARMSRRITRNLEINENMELVMNKTEDMLLTFDIDENGELGVII